MRKLLIDAVRAGSGDPHRALLVESVLALAQADDEVREINPRLFKRWRWRDASRIADAIDDSPWALTEFLVEISDSIDQPKPCLARARVTLERIGPKSKSGGDYETLTGAVLVRQDSKAFTKRFPKILSAISGGSGAGHWLCRWLMSDSVDSVTRGLLRDALDHVPEQERDQDVEVRLAARDGLAALKLDDRRAVREALGRMQKFTIGATYPAHAIHSLLKPLMRRRLFLPSCRALLEATSHMRDTEMLEPLRKTIRRLT